MTDAERTPGSWEVPDANARADRVAEWLLVETVQELDRLVAAERATPFETLDIATLVRRTLLDGAPLVNQARRRLSLKAPTFECTPMQDERSVMVYLGATPRFEVGKEPFGAPTTRLTMDQFKGAAVCAVDGRVYTVRDVVKYFANVRGGVHLGKPDSPFEDLMLLVDSTITTGVWPMPWMILAYIGETTANALRPIADEFKPDVPAGWTKPWRPSNYGYRQSY